MDIILWIVLGALAGWIASIITGTNAQMGWMGNIIVGIIGAFIGNGSRIARVVFGNTGLNLAHEICADVGAFGEDTTT